MKAKVTGPKGAVELPATEIVRIDPTAKPAVMDDKGPDGKVSLGVYEFVSENKIKYRGAEPGKPRPAAVAVPDEKSSDHYFELERVAE
jgi:hypothetical protein